MKIIRVMTFNIRFDNPGDVHKRWADRKDMVASVVKRYHPQIIGIQEATWNQIRDLRQALPEYGFCVQGRVWDDTCQYPTIFFKKDDVSCHHNEDFWLSSTPGVHRSNDWGSLFPRMVSYGRFRLYESSSIVAAVTHLDHKSETARAKQSDAVVKWYKYTIVQEPFVLMGDFNEPPYQRVYNILLDAGLADTWQALGFQEDEDAMTHHNFNGIPDFGRIDWIFVSSHFSVLNGSIVRDNWEGRYPSDHFPYYVDIALKELS